MISSNPWWRRPDLRRPAAAYRQVVAGGQARDRAARRRAPATDGAGTPEVMAHFFAGIAALSVHSEDVGGFAAEALLATGLPAELRAALIRAMWDEIRHSDMFLDLANDLGVDCDATDLAPIGRLLTTLDRATSPAEFAVVHTELEALALDVFRLVAQAVPGSRIRDTYAIVAIDEASHVRLGLDIVRHLGASGERIDADRIDELVLRAAEQTPQGDPGLLALLCRLLGLPLDPTSVALQQRRQRRREHFARLLATSPA